MFFMQHKLEFQLNRMSRGPEARVLFIFSCGLILFLASLYGNKGVISPERPVVPNVTATSPTEIKMNWCRVNSNNVEIDHYELFIDNELEYSGIDVMYVAKRLKPWTAYEIKLRACGFLSGASCSPFSRPILVKTLSDGDNRTTIKSTASMFKVVVLPTYSFIIGVLVGVVILAMALIWRYLQCNDAWTNDPPFELPQYVQQQTTIDKECKDQLTLQGPSNINSTGFGPLTDKIPLQDQDNSYFQIADVSERPFEQKGKASPCHISRHDISVQASILCAPDVLSSSITPDGPQDQLTFSVSVQKVVQDGQRFVPSICDSHMKGEQVKQDCENSVRRERSLSNTNKVEMSGNIITVPSTIDCHISHPGNHVGCHGDNKSDRATLTYAQEQPCSGTTKCNDNSQDEVNVTETEHISETEQQPHKNYSEKYSTSHGMTCDDTSGIVCVIDNSNIYIGAQECASAANTGDRKRNVRVKLQNLVRILEKNRVKERSFVCGSSPPATEHVWEVYRHLGYIVDLEERRGKDEQRVDEGLHLCIYKAICELSPRVLVLATGDGMKGKSENATSFPGCAAMALERGWHVELYSWKHSLSTEWNKLAKRFPDRLQIHFLDSYVNHITFVDGRNGRKCLPLHAELERKGNTEQKVGRPMHHG